MIRNFEMFGVFIPSTLIAILFLIPIIFIYYRLKIELKKSKRKPKDCLHLGIFHPYCNDGGGGEKVLWTAVGAILNEYPKTKVIIYTGDVEYSPNEIISKVRQRFNIALPDKIKFVYLTRRKWVEASMYPYFTLLGQSLGSAWLGLEALLSYCPDVYLDTTGYAFTYPIFKYIGWCKVATYTHYPIITSDMLKRVSGRLVTYNNRRVVANSPFLTAGKLLYYQIFARMYGLVGKCADVVMVNSTWTEDHINELWNRPLSTHRVFPPCSVDGLKAIPRPCEDIKPDELIKIISVGQFRPEKNHPLQLKAMYELRQILPESMWEKVRLVIVGSCRNSGDRNRVTDMKDLCKHLALEKNVIFKLNVSFEELKKELSEATIGLHAMWNEHFGIGVVECLAAGLLTIAHRSGGPKSDIIIESEGSRNGFLAVSDCEYAQTMAAIMLMSPEQRETIILAARSSVDRFSVNEFEKQFLRTMDPLLRKE